MVEILLGVTLFVLIFSHTMTAFAPTATDYQRMVRGFTMAINVANWYINHIEGIITYQGELPASEMGIERDVTTVVTERFGASLGELRELKVTATLVQVGPSLVQISVNLDWGGSGRGHHQYTLSRLKAIPRL
jgi:hypothetical protein